MVSWNTYLFDKYWKNWGLAFQIGVDFFLVVAHLDFKYSWSLDFLEGLGKGKVKRGKILQLSIFQTVLSFKDSLL